MQAALIHEHGGLDKLVVETAPDPVPQAGEVVIRVRACALNYHDVFTVRGNSYRLRDLERKLQ